MPLFVSNAGGPTQAQMRRLFAILREHGLDRDDLAELMAQEGLGEDPQALTREAYDLLCDDLIPSFGRLADAG